MPRMEEITVIYRREKFRSDDNFVIALADVDLSTNGGGRQPISIKGTAAEDDFIAGLSYRLYGRRSRHETYGEQFNFQTFVRATPHGRQGVIRYLSKCSGVGNVTASRLWDRFQSDAVRILRESPDVAVAAVDMPHFTEAKAAAAAEFLRHEQRLENCTIDLTDLLDGRGFPRATIKRAIQRWGNRAYEIIKRTPYSLMLFRGCGFLRADAMYLDLGGDPASIKRQALCAWHTLAKDSEGHTWQTAEAVLAGLREKVAGTELKPEAAVLLASRGKLIAQRRDASGRLWLAEKKRADAEERCARFAALALTEGETSWPELTEADGLSEHQAAEWAKATTHRLGIFTGGGGCGKTYTVARAVSKIIGEHGKDSLAICAPTWAAANRVMDQLAEHKIEHEATSIHSMLGVAQKDDNEGWSFAHNEYCPLPARFILLDEASMVDVSLMASVLAARAAGAHLLLVGDQHQLPPVGHGAPLRDLVAAGVPLGELTEPRRNAGTIVQAGLAMRAGRPFVSDDKIDLNSEPPKNLKIIDVPGGGASRQIGELLRVLQIAAANGRDPVWDVQVIVAVNAKSELSRREINRLLQRHLNKSGVKAGSNPFLPGDKIVKALKSAFFTEVSRLNERSTWTNGGEIFVSNREEAAVVEVADKWTIAKLLRRGEEVFIRIPRGGGSTTVDDEQDERRAVDGGDGNEKRPDTGCDWDLGYAKTCHIAQGNQWPWVVVLIDEYPGAKMIAQKEWIYTAFSRPQELCIGIGNKQTVVQGLRRSALGKRKTFLQELVCEQLKGILVHE